MSLVQTPVTNLPSWNPVFAWATNMIVVSELTLVGFLFASEALGLIVCGSEGVVDFLPPATSPTEKPERGHVWIGLEKAETGNYLI